MRTLKRSLALVLCIVMVLGLCAFNVSAKTIDDYPDNKEIVYREAVQLLSQLNVINGRSTGDQGYDPKANLTRAEGATIIVRLLGITNPIGTSSFSDVEDFYQPFVAYLENLKIIAGYGDGRFGQNDSLTGSAFAKMLLCAGGYDANREGLLGSQWEIGVAKLVKSAGLDEDMVNFDQTKAINREEAAQMAMNALKMTEVEYDGAEFSYNNANDGTTIVYNGGNGRKEVTSSKNSAKNIDDRKVDGNYTLEFGEDHYSNLRYNPKEEDAWDDLYRPANVWSLNGTVICREAKTPVAVFTDGSSINEIVSKLSGYRFFYSLVSPNSYTTSSYNIDDSSSSSNNQRVYYMLAEKDDQNDKMIPRTDSYGYVHLMGGTENRERTNYIENSAVKTPAAFIKDNMLGDGKRVEFFAEDNYITDVVEITYNAAKVSNIVTASNGDVTYTFSNTVFTSQYAGNSAGTRHLYSNTNSNSDIEIHGTTSIAKNDYVTYVMGQKKLHVYPTTVITGRQTSNNGDNKIVVNGTTYVLNALWKNVSGRFNSTFNNSTSSRNYYLDQYNFVVKTDNAEVAIDEFAIVESIALVQTGGVSNSQYAEAILVFTDGSRHTVKVTKLTPPYSDEELKLKDYDLITDHNVSRYEMDEEMSAYPSQNWVYKGIVKYSNNNGDFSLDYYNVEDHYGVMSWAPTVGKTVEFLKKGTARIGTNSYTKTYGWRTSGDYYDDVGGDSDPVASPYGTDSTVYIIETGDWDNPKVGRYVGYNAVPSLESKYETTDRSNPVFIYGEYVRGGSSNSIRLVYIDATNASQGTEAKNNSDDRLFYPTSGDAGRVGSNADNGYSFREGVLDGTLREGENALRADYGDYSKMGQLKEKEFHIVAVDDKGYVDFDDTDTRTLQQLAEMDSSDSGPTDENFRYYKDYLIGSVTEDTLDGIATGLNGYVLTSSSKVYVIDDGNVYGPYDNLDSAQLADDFVVQLKDDYVKSNADSRTIKVAYLVRDPNKVTLHNDNGIAITADDVNRAFNSGKTEVIVDGNLYDPGADLQVLRGHKLTVRGNIDVKSLTVYGELILNGNNDRTIDGNVTITGQGSRMASTRSVTINDRLALGSYSVLSIKRPKDDADFAWLELGRGATVTIASTVDAYADDVWAVDYNDVTITASEGGAIRTSDGDEIKSTTDLYYTVILTLPADVPESGVLFSNLGLEYRRVGDTLVIRVPNNEFVAYAVLNGNLGYDDNLYTDASINVEYVGEADHFMSGTVDLTAAVTFKAPDGYEFTARQASLSGKLNTSGKATVTIPSNVEVKDAEGNVTTVNTWRVVEDGTQVSSGSYSFGSNKTLEAVVS